MCIPQQMIRDTTYVCQLSDVFFYTYFGLFKMEHKPLYNNYSVDIGDTHLHQLYNVPTFDNYIMKNNNDNYGIYPYIRNIDIGKENGTYKEITLDIYNDNNELYGYVKQNVYFTREL